MVLCQPGGQWKEVFRKDLSWVHFFFGILVNDLPAKIDQCSVSLYADDTALYHSSRDSAELKDTLESALDGVASWVDNNRLKMNVKKTQVMFLGRRSRRKEVEHALLVHQGVTLTAEPKVKFLGVIVDKDLNWSEHVTSIKGKCLASMAQLRRIFPAVPRRTRVLLYNTLVIPHYCSCVWGTCGVNLKMKLERIQNYAMRLITSAKPRTPSAQLRSELSWMSLKDRREMQVVSKVHSCLHGRAPAYLCSKFSRNLNAEYRETRGANNIQLQCPHMNFYSGRNKK